MKVGLKSSLRPFLYRALQLFKIVGGGHVSFLSLQDLSLLTTESLRFDSWSGLSCDILLPHHQSGWN